MKRTELRDRIMSGRMSRRQFAKALAAAGLGFAMLPITRRGARADDQAIYFTWSGYDDPGFHPAYVEKHGASPEMPIFADAEEALTKIRGGFLVDVAHPCNLDLLRWRDAGVLQPLDTARLRHWPDLFDGLKNIDDGRDGTTHYFVPIDWGNTSVIYRPDLVDIDEESWSLLWDERYAGRISMAHDATESVVIAGIVGGAKDPFNMTEAELAEAKELLAKQKGLNRFYWDNNTTVEQALASGELVAATGWNSSVVTLKDQGVPVAFMNPKEGIMNYVCGLVLLKDAPAPDKAYDLLNAMTAPEAGAWLIEFMGYGHSNKKTFDLVDDSLLAERGLPKNPTSMLEKGIMQKSIANQDAYQTMFEQVKAGV